MARGARRKPGPASGRAPGRAPPITIVKLGGSLAASDSLILWLDSLTAIGGRLVVVPGGGPFADQVRATQGRWGFDDATAHHLAILAMEQFGRMLCALCPALSPAASRAAIRRAWRGGRIPVWLPAGMAVGHADIPESWQVTSDSLAAWLAGVLGAGRLILVKSTPPPIGPVAAEELARRGLVDPAFPRFVARAGCPAWCVGPAEAGTLAAALATGGEAGARITVDSHHDA